MVDKLNAGDQFPQLSLQLGDSTTALPELKGSGYSILLFYRGHW